MIILDTHSWIGWVLDAKLLEYEYVQTPQK